MATMRACAYGERRKAITASPATGDVVGEAAAAAQQRGVLDARHGAAAAEAGGRVVRTVVDAGHGSVAVLESARMSAARSDRKVARNDAPAPRTRRVLGDAQVRGVLEDGELGAGDALGDRRAISGVAPTSRRRR